MYGPTVGRERWFQGDRVTVLRSCQSAITLLSRVEMWSEMAVSSASIVLAGMGGMTGEIMVMGSERTIESL